MSGAAKGTVSVTYRPLMTMDKLHVLLLAAVSQQNTDVALLEQVFSLPTNVITKELLVLEGYGLTQKVDGKWLATERGRRINAVWYSFGKRQTTEVVATGRQWLLGPGEFMVDEMIRDKSEINDLARGFGVNDAASAVRYLVDRRSAADRFESFVLDWPRRRGDAKHGVFAEALVFAAVEVAETDEALSRLKQLLDANVREVVNRRPRAKVAARHADGDGEANSVETLGQEVLKRFEEARRNQRKLNRELAKKKAACEAWLAGKWLSKNLASLCGIFDAEPAAFLFRSTVPLAGPKAARRPVASRPPSSQYPQSTVETMQQEGILQSLFRWLFG